jgi:putative ABC transport system permease protein
MTGYHLRLALLALKRNRVLTALMVCAIGIGIGASMTALTVFYAMSGNPMADKNGTLFVPLLDNWAPDQPWDDESNDPPRMMTYRDAMNLQRSNQARRMVVMTTNVYAVQPPDRKVPAFHARARMTTHEFFPMFEPPFRYGSGWDRAQDEATARVVVLPHETNQKVFGGADSVGQTLRVGEEDFTVVGVLEQWNPLPRVYDLTGGAYNDADELFMPFSYGIERENHSSQNNSCWKDPGDTYQGWLESECIWLNAWVELDGEADRARYRAFLDSYVLEQKKLGRFPRPLNNRLFSIPEWLDNQKVVRDDTRIQLVLALSFLGVCLINTVGLLLAKFMGRAGEIGLRRGVGVSRRTIFAQFLTEAGLVGLCGGLLGLALTAGGVAGMGTLDETIARIARIDAVMVASAIGLAVFSALLAGLLPTWRACLIAPATQLKSQ